MAVENSFECRVLAQAQRYRLGVEGHRRTMRCSGLAQLEWRLAADPSVRRAFRRAISCSEENRMKYKVVLNRSEEGVAASVPGLPGCWSQGETEAEALENVRSAIQEYLAVVAEQIQGAEVREVEVSV
jgi:predicted RNase H-like HicB family nuclease